MLHYLNCDQPHHFYSTQDKKCRLYIAMSAVYTPLRPLLHLVLKCDLYLVIMIDNEKHTLMQGVNVS